MTENVTDMDKMPPGYKSMAAEMNLSEQELDQILFAAVNQQYQQRIAQQAQAEDEPAIPDAEGEEAADGDEE